MIIVYQSEKTKIFHLVRAMGRDGFSVGITAYCGDKSSGNINQLPDKYADKTCNSCQAELKKIS